MPRPDNYDRDEVVRLITNAMLASGCHVSAAQLGTGNSIVRLQYKGAHIDIRPVRKKEVDNAWREEYNKALREARTALRASYPKDYDMLYKLYKDDGILPAKASARAYSQLTKRYPTEWKRLLAKYTKGGAK